MADITPLIQQYTVDFASNNNFLFVKGVQGDGNQTRYVDISLMNNGQAYEVDPESVRVVLRGTKPDSTLIFNECEIIGSNKIRVEITSQMSAVVGKSNYEISVMSLLYNQAITSFPFYIIISESSTDVEAITSSNEFLLLVNKINLADRANEQSNALIERQEALEVELQKTIDTAEDVTADSRSATSALRTYHNEVKSAESARVSAENTRKTNENKRISAENTRIENEETREANENQRIANEETRQTNEAQRIADENIRKENESTRQTNETVRQNAETTRVENENQRIADEETRQANEEDRIKQAEDFADAESVRAENENVRQSAEETRNASEELRQQQEVTRQENTATAITNAETATRNAMDVVDLIVETAGIKDNPTEEEASMVAYSASKVQSMYDSITSVTYATLPLSGWSNTTPYTQTIEVAEMKEEYSPTISCDLSNIETETEKKQTQKSWGFVDEIEVGNGILIATCKFNKPTININIVIKGI